MKCIATYPSYQLANDRQLDLLAAEIDARVEYVPNGVEQVYLGANPIYALMVPEEKAADAIELIRLMADEAHQALFRCPQCASNDVQEHGLDGGFGTGPFSLPLTLGLVAIARMVAMRTRGIRFECRSCGAVYRKKP